MAEGKVVTKKKRKRPVKEAKKAHQVKVKKRSRRSHTIDDHREYIANLIAGLIVFLGMMNVISVILPYFTDQLSYIPSIKFLPPEFEEAGGFLQVLVGMFLISFGINLYRRSGGAWTVILFFLIFSLIASILRATTPSSIATFIFTLYLISMLWHYRDVFRTPSYFKLSPKRMATVLFALIMIIFGIIGSMTLGKQFVPEIETWTNAVYFTMSTITTVGFGDYVPNTPAAQWFTIVLMIFGFTSFLLLIGSLLGPYIEQRLLRVIGMAAGRKAERLANHLIVCGLSVEGRIVVETLKERNEIFVVVCGSEEKHEEMVAEGIHIVHGDPTSFEMLDKVGVKKARALMALAEDDAVNAFVTITARKMNPDLLIVAMVSSRENMKKLRSVGADKVISPNVIGAEKLLGAALGEEAVICKG